MLKDELFYFPNGFRRYSDVSSKSDRMQPEFALAVRGFDVYVRWFLALVGIEVKSECAYA